MTDFSHLKKLDVTSENTQEYPMPEVVDDAVLILRPANESNKGYINALLRMTGKHGMRKVKAKLDSKALEKQRDQDKELYPDHVIVGWKGIVDSKNKPVKFTPKAAAEFIDVLPNWLFDGVRTFASVPANFIEVIDSEDKAGN